MTKKIRKVSKTVLFASGGGKPGNAKLLDLPESTIKGIFEYLPQQEIFWNLGFTCRQLLDISCGYINIIEIPYLPQSQKSGSKDIFESYINDLAQLGNVLDSIRSILVCQRKDREDLLEEFQRNGDVKSNV